MPDIFKLNTGIMKDMNGLFYNYLSLISITDISKWKTNHLQDISEVFYNYSLLLSPLDLSTVYSKINCSLGF